MTSQLDQLGLGLEDVVKYLMMIDDINKWDRFNKVYTAYFKPPYPARSAFGVDGLALRAALELEYTAVARCLLLVLASSLLSRAEGPAGITVVVGMH